MVIKKRCKPRTTSKTHHESDIYYLSPHGEKGWKIIRQGASKASWVFNTKEEALKKAREFGRENKVAIIVKRKDGTVAESLNYK